MTEYITDKYMPNKLFPKRNIIYSFYYYSYNRDMLKKLVGEIQKINKFTL